MADENTNHQIAHHCNNSKNNTKIWNLNKHIVINYYIKYKCNYIEKSNKIVKISVRIMKLIILYNLWSIFRNVTRS